jgi:hypothetical protein
MAAMGELYGRPEGLRYASREPHFSTLAGPRLRDASAELAVALAKAAHPRSLSRGDFRLR